MLKAGRFNTRLAFYLRKKNIMARKCESCVYSKSMDQKYPRSCINCGVPEEPKAAKWIPPEITDVGTVVANRIEELERICSESYQILSLFIDKLPDTKILDNLASCELIHDDVLPFELKESDSILTASQIEYLNEISARYMYKEPLFTETHELLLNTSMDVLKRSGLLPENFECSTSNYRTSTLHEALDAQKQENKRLSAEFDNMQRIHTEYLERAVYPPLLEPYKSLKVQNIALFNLIGEVLQEAQELNTKRILEFKRQPEGYNIIFAAKPGETQEDADKWMDDFIRNGCRVITDGNA